jgi:flavin-dependent dehydrogenase
MVGRLEALLPGSTAGARSWRGHHLPLSAARSGREQPGGRVLFAGDAAGLVNPLTGEGIYYAVATGALAGRLAVGTRAAEAPAAEAPGAAYRRAVRRLLRTNLASTAGAAAMASTPRVLSAGLRAAAADQAVFDDLVELGLGRGRITAGLATGLVRGLAEV